MDRNKNNMTKEQVIDPQYMDINYQQWYLVPSPDCQIFDEMEGSEYGTVPTWIDGKPVTFVDPEWLFNEE